MRKFLLLILSFLSLLPCTILAQGDDPDVIEFCFLTDTHKWGPTADVRYADANIRAFVDYCNDNPKIEFALFGGDFMNAYDTNHEQALFCLEHARRDFEGLRVPFYTTKGNHDCNGKQRDKNGRRDNTQIITDHEYYQLFHPLSPSNPLRDSTGIVIDPIHPEGNYYYRDFERQHFRLIVLNDYDIDSLEYYGYHGPQMKWLAERALDFTDKADATQWSFLILGHGFGFNMFGKPISRLLHAYNNGQDFEDSDRGYSYHCQYDRVPRAHLVALLGGHNHEDLYDVPDGYNIIHVNRGFATGGEVGIPEEELCFSHFILNTRTHTLTEHRIGRGRDHTFSYSPSEQIDPSPTFPEAMGMGGYTHGGSKGKQIWVTNLNDNGPGSLRWAVSQKGNRMVCFKVSGTIQLQSPIIITNDSLSICGHSAPGQGIALQGHSLQVQASEVIIRYLHLRSCELSDHDFGQHDLIFDHLSCSFTEGPAIAIRRAQNVTVQNCLVSHCRNIGIEAGGYMATYYNNLIANCPSAIHFPDNEGENRWIHIFRNVVDNWRDHAMYGGGSGGEITIEENYFSPGFAMVNPQMLDVAADGTGRYYASKNVMRGREKEWDNTLINDRPGLPYDPAPTSELDSLRQRMDLVARAPKGDFTKSCITIAAFHYRSLFSRPTAYQTYREVLLAAGCSLDRDKYDRNVIASIRQNTTMGSRADGLFSDVKSLGGYPKIKREQHNPTFSVLANWLDHRTAAVNDRSIVVLYEDDSDGRYDVYPVLAGYHDAILSDSCHLSVVSLGNFLPPAATALADSATSLADSAVIRLMQEIGYEAIALGENEMSRTKTELRRQLKPFQHCVVSANLRDKDRQYALAFRPYVLKHYGRRTVAFVGLTNPSQTFTSEQFAVSLQQGIDHARQEGADYVVLLTNLFDGTSTPQQMLYITRIVSDLRGVDVVLDGSPSQAVPQETLYDRDGKPVIFSRTGGSHSYVGKLIIAPDGLITTQLLPVERLRFKSRRITQLFDRLTSAQP